MFNRLNKIIFFLLPSAFSRGKFLEEKKVFNEVGSNIFFQPRKLPSDPKLIRFKNNIAVASDVTFVNHDVIHHVFNNINNNSTEFHMGCIEVGNNVFIGARSTVMPNVRIGDNCIIAAGCVVTKDIPEGSVVAGVPARIIGSFDDVFIERKIEKQYNLGKSRDEIIKDLWNTFELKNNGRKSL